MERRDMDIIDNGQINWQMYRDKKVLITGATGRIGRYIAESFIEVDINYNLNMRIYLVARSEKKAMEIYGNALDFANVILVLQDINEPIVLDTTVDYIFHTAGPAAPVDFKSTSVETLWAHVNGTRNVLECARQCNTKRVFYVSTVEVYGEWKGEDNIKETDMGPLHNNNFRACYPEAKRMCETMLACYQEEYGIDYNIVRLTHTLGPGIALDDGRAFAEFINCARNGEDIVLQSDGSAMRAYTYTADVINAVFLIMQKGEKNSVYNVMADENMVSVRDLAELIAGLSKKKIKVTFGGEAGKLPYLPFKLAVMDTSKIRALGWRPRTSLEDTFARTMDSFE